MVISRRTRENFEKLEEDQVYELADALSTLKGLRLAKFDETVEVVARLGVDPRKSDQMVRGAVSLPHGLGKTVRVIVFAEGDAADQASEAGAMEVGGDELAKKIEGGWQDFDIVIAHPAMMKVVGRLGRVLGPQGKMPSPKSGTVTPDVVKATTEFLAGKVEFRVDSAGNIHVPVGKASFSAEKLVENASTFLDLIISMRPATAKGTYLRNVSISTTMGPGLKVSYGS
ncbi:MAG TPA: 50S ribosomal protein L1 [Planctomycetota bacterium]|jgi:large subunit ribosomal protein L1|nr:50S ribosomal protein L1 [Planctomycetota bacterium]MDP7246011.1 50S ribosomal protein L1 [Planctomycetota bacterium]MDP7561142.1 50S ribosomal protein L1 [Planctomycetota bacterium]HJM39663.1 50S ribosomal protein L1 [Planctomycetota bacterium]|tara:strand:+ start:33836 stop:34519 length:684 start_codon:yes stop_codon:yes gene_type:complete